jgi:hypothetical protein
MIADELVRFGRQAKQGATFGFADEIQDIVAAVPAAAFTDMSYKEALAMARELSKDQLAQDWEDAPITSMAGQVAGGIPLGFTKAGLAATNWIRGGSALSGVGKGAALGAGLGAAAGVGAADDTVSDRVTGGGVGAVIGGVAGGATAPLARLGGSADKLDFRKVADKTTKPFKNKAQAEMARQLSARPDLQEQLARAEAMSQAAQRTGIQLTLPEMVAQFPNDTLLDQQAIIGSNPMTAGRMAQMYAARSGTPKQQGQIEASLMRLARELDPNVGSYDEAANALIEAGKGSQKAITKKLVSEASPLYQDAFKANPAMQSKRLDRILSTPEGSRALKEVASDYMNQMKLMAKPDKELGEIARDLASYGSIDKPEGGVGKGLSLRALDAIKKRIDKSVQLSKRAAEMGSSADGDRYAALEALRKNLVDEIDQLDVTRMAGPVAEKIDGGLYEQARNVYSSQPDQLELRRYMGGLADIDPLKNKSVNRALFGGTQQNADLAAQALGDRAPTAAAARIYDAMDAARGDPVTLASRIAPDKRTADMLRTYAGGNQLDETLSVINQANLGERSRYNSVTQPRQQADEVLKNAASGALNTAIDVKTGGIIPILRGVARVLGRGSQEQDPQFYADMADLMLTDQGMDLLRRVASGQQNAIQELQQVGLPSIIGGGVSQATRSAPVSTAAIGGMVTPPRDSVVFNPQENRFNEFDRILQQQYTPQQMQRFNEFDRLLEGVR